ncbi:MAG: glycosyltransferase [Saprospiraceae bacterium]
MYLHVVSFDIPYPANYGGVIVVFNQIKALHALGVKVILHCYQYGGRTQQDVLGQFCHEINYYPRSRSLWYQIGLLPFIMRTRQSQALLRRLKRDKHPILFEGMHTAGLVWRKQLRGRQKVVRMHNVEWQYYESLAELTDSWPAKLYFFVESLRLQRTELKVLLHSDDVITLSLTDQAYFKQFKVNVQYVPAFHPNAAVECLPGRGDYVLFHGNLSVPDNDKAAQWLVNEVFSDLNIPFVIAGMEPTDSLRELAAKHEHITLVDNPNEQRMVDLIKNAHINVLVSFQSSGVKLKLLNALFRGRYCIVNDAMVSGMDLKSLCYVRNSAAAIRQTVEALINAPFDTSKINDRKSVLETQFSNRENARKLIDIIKFP